MGAFEREVLNRTETLPGVRLEQGIVTSVSPLLVRTGGSSVAVPAVSLAAVAVGETVQVLKQEAGAPLVLGVAASGRGWVPIDSGSFSGTGVTVSDLPVYRMLRLTAHGSMSAQARARLRLNGVSSSVYRFRRSSFQLDLTSFGAVGSDGTEWQLGYWGENPPLSTLEVTIMGADQARPTFQARLGTGSGTSLITLSHGAMTADLAAGRVTSVDLGAMGATFQSSSYVLEGYRA